MSFYLLLGKKSVVGVGGDLILTEVKESNVVSIVKDYILKVVK